MSERVEVHVEGSPQKPRGGGGGGALMMVPGLFFMGLGVSVLVWPKVLQIMVAAFFLMIGFGLLFGASRVKRVRRQWTMFDSMPPRPPGPPPA